MAHYVYALFDEQGIPFYIGKGQGYRYKHHLRKSHNKFVNYKIAKIRSAGFEPRSEIIASFETEESALDLEEFLIKSYTIRDDGGPLCNFEYNPRSTGNQKGKRSTKARPVYHKGFIFPSRTVAAAKTQTAVNTFTRMVHRKWTVYLDDEFFQECIADYSKYESAVKKWQDHLSKRHPNAKRIYVDGVIYDARDDVPANTDYSLWYIKQVVNDPQIKNIYYVDGQEI